MAENLFCDPVTGQCEPGELPQSTGFNQREGTKGLESLIYVTDPMCSWCWGYAPEITQLKTHYEKEGIAMKIVMGGLRPGGGDIWDENMRKMLRHHWESVHQRTGQPFDYKLLDLEEFNYDTEPPCRAIVAARTLDEACELDFLKAIQYQFYVNSLDPNDLSFYEPICDKLKLDFERFSLLFNHHDIIKQTWHEFRLNREWGVRGYPTTLYQYQQKLYLISPGYAPFKQIRDHIEKIKTVILQEIQL